MSRQAVKYQTTNIDPSKSAAEIAEFVRKYGGSRFELCWDHYGQLEAVRFAVRHETVGEVPVLLRAPFETILKILWDARGRNSRKTREDLEEQARRIAWRHLKDLTEQLLLAVHLGLKSLPGAFMADIEIWDDESQETTTMAELFGARARIEPTGRGVRLLTHGGAP